MTCYFQVLHFSSLMCVSRTMNFVIYIQLYSSFNDSRKKTKTKTDNRQETETRLNVNSHINHIKSFRSRLAQPKTELHTELSISTNFVNNFCLRHTIKLDTDWLLNMTRHSFTMSLDDVLNNFINIRVCYIMSKDRLSATLSWQESTSIQQDRHTFRRY